MTAPLGWDVIAGLEGRLETLKREAQVVEKRIDQRILKHKVLHEQRDRFDNVFDMVADFFGMVGDLLDRLHDIDGAEGQAYLDQQRTQLLALREQIKALEVTLASSTGIEAPGQWNPPDKHDPDWHRGANHADTPTPEPPISPYPEPQQADGYYGDGRPDDLGGN